MVRGFRLRGTDPSPPHQQPPKAVSVNAQARLARMSLDMLHQHAETEIMMAGQKYSQWREGLDPSLIDQAVEHAGWALDALRALRDRG